MADTATLIEAERSLSVATHVPTLEELDTLVKYTYDVPGVDSYVLVSVVGLEGLAAGVDIIRSHDPNKKIFYDHQQAGTHDPRLATPFLQKVSESGVDAIVLFPPNEMAPQREWIQAAHEHGLEVIVGPENSRYTNIGSEIVKLYLRQAVRNDVLNIWVRGDNPRRLAMYRDALETEAHGKQHAFFIPRYVDEFGNTNYRIQPGVPMHFVIGRAICNAADPRKEAMRLSEHLTEGKY